VIRSSAPIRPIEEEAEATRAPTAAQDAAAAYRAVSPGAGEEVGAAGGEGDGAAPGLRPLLGSILEVPPAQPSAQVGSSRQRVARLTIASLWVALVVTSLAAAGVGAVTVSPGEILAAVGHRLGWVEAVDPTVDAIVMVIRLPRVLLGILVGSAIACCGVLLQGLFRNPLADSGLLGISSGASVAVAAAVVAGASLDGVGGLLGAATLPITAFVGALITIWLVGRIASSGGRTDITTLLLAGIAITAVAEAGVSLASFLSTENQLRTISTWRMGSLGGATWLGSVWVAIPVALLFLSARRLGRSLDALLLGEREAAHLGIEVEPLKRKIVILVALAVGASVAATGIIGFVGLVVPNLMRLAIGPGHRYLLPASALGGGVLVLGADLLARTVIAPAELPIGIVTAAIGSPFFIYLLLRHKKRIA